MDRFWEHKAVEDMTTSEWESLCDGCGQCCLVKVEDDEQEVGCVTLFSCKELDYDSCRCRSYEDRLEKVPGCTKMTPKLALTLPWLPDTCAYRLVVRGDTLPEWHHLLCGDPLRVHEEEGVSVKKIAISEEYIPDDFEWDAVALRWFELRDIC